MLTSAIAMIAFVQSPAFVGVDLRAVNMPIRRVLAEFTRQLPQERFEVDRAVQGNVTSSFFNLPYDSALARVLCQTQANWKTEIISRTQGRSPDAPTQTVRRISPQSKSPGSMNINLENTDVRDVLRQLFKVKNSSYTVETDVRGKVTLQGEGETFESLLGRAVSQARAAYRVESGIYVIWNTANPVPPGLLETKWPECKLDKVRRNEALSQFARRAGFTVEVQGNVNLGDRVTLTSSGEPVGSILAKILGPKNAYRIEDGVLVVAPK